MNTVVDHYSERPTDGGAVAPERGPPRNVSRISPCANIANRLLATPTEPATSAIFRALCSVDLDPGLTYEAAEESHQEAGQNVIAVIGAQIAEFRPELDTSFAEFKSKTPRFDPR